MVYQTIDLNEDGLIDFIELWVEYQMFIYLYVTTACTVLLSVPLRMVLAAVQHWMK